jgi:hypothetical protein
MTVIATAIAEWRLAPNLTSSVCWDCWHRAKGLTALLEPVAAQYIPKYELVQAAAFDHPYYGTVLREVNRRNVRTQQYPRRAS